MSASIIRQHSRSEKYRRHLERARDSSNWFTFFRLYYRIMRRLDALFLQDLHNLSSMKAVKKRKIDGKVFFQCTIGFLFNSDSEWTAKEQRHHFENLKVKGYIKIVRSGSPPTRWVRINVTKIEGDLDEAERKKGNFQTGQKGHVRTGQKGHVKKEEEKKETVAGVSPPSSNGHPSRSAVKLARLLHEKILSEKKLQRSALPFGLWPVGFARLEKKYGADRLKVVTRWYVEHFGEPYVPVALSVRSYADKFLRIEEAMERRNRSQNQEQNNHVW